MRKTLVILFFLLCSFSLFSQDIIYDESTGNQSNFLKIKEGEKEELLITFYENSGFLSSSKILRATGNLTDLEENIDYEIYNYYHDTLLYEFSTGSNINMIIYKYYYNDSIFHYYLGLRKAELGSNLFEGQYLFVTQLSSKNSEFSYNVYSGLGESRELFYTIRFDDLSDALIGDYELSNQVSLQFFNDTKFLLVCKTDQLLNIPDISNESCKIFPNPAGDYINIEMIDISNEVSIKVFNSLPMLIFETHNYSDNITLNVSGYPSGLYYIVISDKKEGNIIYNSEIIIKHE